MKKSTDCKFDMIGVAGEFYRTYKVKQDKNLCEVYNHYINGKIECFGVYKITYKDGKFIRNMVLYSPVVGYYYITEVEVYKIFYKDKVSNKYISLKPKIYVYEDSDYDDLYCINVCRSAAKYSINIYKNDILQRSIEAISYSFCKNDPNKLLYTNCTEKSFLLDVVINEEEIIDSELKKKDAQDSIGIKEHLRYFPNNDGIRFDKENVYFYISYVKKKSFAVLFEYFQEANKIEIIKNEFDDDRTINYRVTYKKNREEDIKFILGVYRDKYSEIIKNAIYGIPLSDIMDCLSYESNYNEIYLKNNKQKYDKYSKIIKKLKNKYSVIKDEELLLILANKYGRFLLNPSIDRTDLSYGYNEEFDKNKYDEIYTKLVNSGQIDSKWISEYNLFKLVKKKFPDAIYQYHCKWLDKQSFDIYIPSIKTAIEYQGEQHFEPIDFFGGKDLYEHRKLLDERKQKLCKKKKVNLIEWKYNEDFNEFLLFEKLGNFNNENYEFMTGNLMNYLNYESIDCIASNNNCKYNPLQDGFVPTRYVDHMIYFDDIHRVFKINNSNLIFLHQIFSMNDIMSVECYCEGVLYYYNYLGESLQKDEYDARMQYYKYHYEDKDCLNIRILNWYTINEEHVCTLNPKKSKCKESMLKAYELIKEVLIENINKE